VSARGRVQARLRTGRYGGRGQYRGWAGASPDVMRTIAILQLMSPALNLCPIRLSRRSKPFDSDDWIFEVKHDGFRALAFVERGECRLVSRNGHTFTRFAELCAVRRRPGGRKRTENRLCDITVCAAPHLKRLSSTFRSGPPEGEPVHFLLDCSL